MDTLLILIRIGSEFRETASGLIEKTSFVRADNIPENANVSDDFLYIKIKKNLWIMTTRANSLNLFVNVSRVSFGYPGNFI